MSTKDHPAKEEQNLRNFLKENVSVMFGLDKRIFATFKHLLLRPGKLTKAFMKGSRHDYTPPATLYFTINLLFFLFLPVINSANFELFAFTYSEFMGGDDVSITKQFIQDDLIDSGLSEAVYQAQFDSFIKYNQPALVFVFIPFFILLFKLLNIKHQNGMLSHAVLAFHFMSYFLLTSLFLGALINLLIPLTNILLDYFSLEGTFSLLVVLVPLIIFIAWLVYYLFKSLTVVYGGPFWINLGKTLLSLAAFWGLFFLYTRCLIVFAILSVN